jgi:cell division protein FtsW (lipid II flippase)
VDCGLWIVVLWFCGFVVLWFCGFVVLWFCGFVVLWFCGFVVLWKLEFSSDQRLADSSIAYAERIERCFGCISPDKSPSYNPQSPLLS